MSFGATETGIERGATKFLWRKAPKIGERYVDGGTVRAVATSLPGSPIVVEYVPEENRRRLVLWSPAVGSAAVEKLRTLLDGEGPVDVVVEAGGAVQTAVFGPEYSFEPVFADLPESAPARLWYWRVRVTLYLMT